MAGGYKNYWCATKVDLSTDEISTGYSDWDYCSEDCPLEVTIE